MVTVSNIVIYQDTKCVYFLIFPEKAIGGTVFPGGGKPYLGKVAFFLGNVSVHGHRGELWLIFSPLGSGTIWCDATFSMWSRPTLPVNVFCMFHRWDICAAPNKEYIPFLLCTGLSTFYYIAANYRAGGKCTPHSLSPPPLHPQACLPFTRAAKSPHCMHTTLQNAANSRIPHLLCPACARHYTAPVENWWQTARQANIPPPKHSGCNRLALIFIALDDREKWPALGLKYGCSLP